MGFFAKLSRKFLLLRRSTTSLPGDATPLPAKPCITEEPAKDRKLAVLSATGNCACCGFNRANGGHWQDASNGQSTSNVCAIRGVDIAKPFTTYCQNFDSHDPAPLGAIFAILPSYGNSCAPWVELSAPHESETTCCICGRQISVGVLLHLPEADVGACGPEHYLAWWSDYLNRRLTYFKTLGEKAYSDMYDVIAFSASGYYSDAKAAFHDAIRTARDLELAEEVRVLEARLAHIKSVFRSQFK